MMIPKKIRKQNKLPLILFLIVFLNYIPLFIANYNTKTSNGVGVKPMVLCFGIECIVLTIFLFKKIKFGKNIIIQTLLLLITTGIMLWIQIQNYKSGNYEIMDFANIICIAVNIVFLFIALLNIEVNEKNIYDFFKGIAILRDNILHSKYSFILSRIISTIWNKYRRKICWIKKFFCT